MDTAYPSDLSDAEWACVQRHLPRELTCRRWPRHSLRTVFDAVFCLPRTGCAWRYLPADFPPWQTVYYHLRRFRLTGVWSGILTAPRHAQREHVGRDLQPSAASMDAQSVKTVEESGRSSGDDGHKRVKGRKRHLLVGTLGLPLSIDVAAADTHDNVGAGRLLAGLKPLVPRLATIWAEGAYTSKKLARWCKACGGWDLEIVGRDREAQGFAVQQRRWLLRHWCHRTGNRSRETPTPLYRLRSALSRLWQEYHEPPRSPLFENSG
jgi:putative transposase